MKIFSGHIYKNLNLTRRIFQVFTLFFLFAIPLLILLEIRLIIGNLYSITILGLEISDPSMLLQNILLSQSFYIPLLISAIIPVVIAAVFGRVFCSWACPYNSILEFFDKLYNSILKRFLVKKKKSDEGINPRPSIYWAIYILLTSTALLIGLPLFTFLSAPGIISSQIAAGIIGSGLGLELVLVFIILTSEVISRKRIWCKYICPVGATLALFRTKYTLRIVHDKLKCDCGGNIDPCQNSCPYNLKPKDGNIYPYCTNCGLCIKTCEKTGKGSLSFSFGNRKKLKM